MWPLDNQCPSNLVLQIPPSAWALLSLWKRGSNLPRRQSLFDGIGGVRNPSLHQAFVIPSWKIHLVGFWRFSGLQEHPYYSMHSPFERVMLWAFSNQTFRGEMTVNWEMTEKCFNITCPHSINKISQSFVFVSKIKEEVFPELLSKLLNRNTESHLTPFSSIFPTSIFQTFLIARMMQVTCQM